MWNQSATPSSDRRHGGLHVLRVSAVAGSIAVSSLAVELGCATIQSGDYAVPLDPLPSPVPSPSPSPSPVPGAGARPATKAPETLAISAGELDWLASPFFGVIEFTFENNGETWAEIDQIDLDFGTPDKNRSVLIPFGADIQTWEAAILERNAVRAANRDTALSLLALGGAVARSAHPRGAAGRAGGVVAVGALATLLASRASEGNGLGSVSEDRFPADALLNLPIRVPPGLFAKRRLLLNTARYPLGGCIDSVILSYRVSRASDAPESHRVRATFKTSVSEWQSRTCQALKGGAIENH
jgi:hypothetical protein